MFCGPCIIIYLRSKNQQDALFKIVHPVGSYCANRSFVSFFPFESFQVRFPPVFSNKQDMVNEVPFRKQVYEAVTQNFVLPIVTSIGNLCSVEELNMKDSMWAQESVMYMLDRICSIKITNYTRWNCYSVLAIIDALLQLDIKLRTSGYN